LRTISSKCHSISNVEMDSLVNPNPNVDASSAGIAARRAGRHRGGVVRLYSGLVSVPRQPTNNPRSGSPKAELSRPGPSIPRRFSRGKELLLIFVALAFSLLVALMLGEIIVRIAAPQDLSGAWSENAPRGYVRNKSGGTARHQFGQRVVYYR